ncbi:uncharacterized protein LOC118182363 [Stegodyphus dumicola]|uniref:uncharacterized protein LOC118182363 n=1 Tax=Stegodyphus dumicola TaxID=202533 RepID=UPI0015A9297D|nr:uncharacterized protein LOC118182363 [Stegodyphus dumicola]
MYPYDYSYHSPGVDDIEKKYRSTLSKTHVRSDRGDLGLHTFAGSHLHGGVPAAEKLTGPKPIPSKTHDLYAPINTRDYGKGYYDHLRAPSPEPRYRPSKFTSDPYTFPADTEYKTLPSKITTDYDNDLKKTTTTKTTVTERWVPLTTYIYNTPFHTYYYRSSPYSSYTYRTADDLYSYDYLDDYKRYSKTTTRTTSKNVDALDLSSSTTHEYKNWMSKCHEIKSQLDEVNKWVSDAETKIKTDITSSRNKIQSELAEVAMVVEDTAKYNEELHRAIKKQAKKIMDLSSQYEDINRNMSTVMDTLEKSRMRCQTLQSDLSSIQSSVSMKYRI